MYIPFITPTIPAATPGRFKSIGYATVYAASRTRHTVPYPQRADGTPVMDLHGVTFAVYYPSSMRPPPRSARNVGWAPRPTDAVVDGYQAYFDIRYTGWLFYLMKKIVGRFKIPLTPNAPVAPVADQQAKYPLVIISHGLAGTRNTYSQYCQALASEGYVVVAIEHRDGSGPMYVVPDEDGNRALHHYAAFKSLQWEAGGKPRDPMRLRGLQLDFRVREMYETYEAMKRIVAGEADAMVESMMVEREREFFSQLRDSVDITNLKIAGHSMGGGTVFRVLQTAPPDGYTPMPVAHAVCLDPWLPPFEFADERPETRQAFPPCLSINSQEYTEWLPHFTQVVHASRAMGASFVTVPDESFSDAEVIGSMSIARARRQLRTCHRLTMSLFSDALDENEYVKCFPEDHGAPARTPRGKLVAHDEVLIHILSVKGVV